MILFKSILRVLPILAVAGCATPINLPITNTPPASNTNTFPASNPTLDQYVPKMIDGPGLPAAAFFSDNVHLMREYFSRSGDTGGSLDSIGKNLNGGRTPLSALAVKYVRETDAFKKQDQAPALKRDVDAILFSGKTVPAVALWQTVYVQPYDFQNKEFTFCFHYDCSPLPGNEVRVRYNTNDYELVIRGIPARVTFSPSDAIAREIERMAASRVISPRSMLVLLVAVFPEPESDSYTRPATGLLYADIAGLRVFRGGEASGANVRPPEAQRLLLTATIKPDFPQSIAAARLPPNQAGLPQATSNTNTVAAVLNCRESLKCPYFAALFNEDDEFRVAIMRAIPPNKLPKWVLSGVESPSLPLVANGRRYVLASVCQPHNCADNSFNVLYDPLERKAVGTLGRVVFGNPSSQQRRILTDLDSSSADLYKKIRAPKAVLPIVVR